MSFDLKELQLRFPEAYNALPESYQNDSCLEFFLDANNYLCAEYDLGGEFLFDLASKKWLEI